MTYTLQCYLITPAQGWRNVTRFLTRFGVLVELPRYCNIVVKKGREHIILCVDVMGYTAWGIIDVVSFTTGEMKKRYGVIYVDRDNQGHGSMRRYKKESFAWYQKVIASDGAETDG